MKKEPEPLGMALLFRTLGFCFFLFVSFFHGVLVGGDLTILERAFLPYLWPMDWEGVAGRMDWQYPRLESYLFFLGALGRAFSVHLVYSGLLNGRERCNSIQEITLHGEYRYSKSYK